MTKKQEKEEEMVLIPVSDLELFQWPTFYIATDDRTSHKKMSISDAFRELEVEADQIRRARIGNAHLRKKLADAVAPLKVVYIDTPPDQIS